MSKRTETTVNLRYQFTPEEKQLFATELANKIKEKDCQEDHLKSLKSDFKSRIDLLSAQINKLSSNLCTGHEYRQTRCMMQLNFQDKIREYYDITTGEFISTEPFKENDYQLKLDLE